MPLEALSSNETLGDSATHFFKSGNIIRNSKNDDLAELSKLLPATGPKNTRVEYDIWYDTGDKDRIHGYVYTDAMAKFVYARIPSAKWSHVAMEEAAKSPITEEGLRIFNDLADNSLDKYKLRKSKETHKFVIFLPGTNIIDKVLCYPKVENAVRQGAKLKCHPITAPAVVAQLKARFGKDAVLDKKLSGHQLMEEATLVGCCKNSEMGLVALAKGKKVFLFDEPKESRVYTYTAVYNTVWEDGTANVEKFKRILSSKESGFIPVIAENPQEYVDGFFNKFKDVPHVAPKNSNS